ncbi:MAG: hypothetical protein A3E85_00230 [Gammaproteobacteria bacterium RIFCSPHIGHO2_12_FULL_45_12]|nr:MAG: hypothetical protein A3E85_00230 [Gammaproteobacteria bacterium RIFCSPHIGHO2_12_FULL_45_12]
MKPYFLIYHYSEKANLSSIDPAYYGSAVSGRSELRRGGSGLNKSFFYTLDKPEPLLQGGTRYQLYLPADWKALIYDIYEDKDKLHLEAKARLLANHTFPYDYRLKEMLETLLIEKGYKGWSNPNSPLPHAIVLFHAISTFKPKEAYVAYHYQSGEVLESGAGLSRQSCCFFNQHLSGSNLKAMPAITTARPY